MTGDTALLQRPLPPLPPQAFSCRPATILPVTTALDTQTLLLNVADPGSSLPTYGTACQLKRRQWPWTNLQGATEV